MNELDNKIKYLLEKTGDQSFDVGMFINPIVGREEFVIGEYCTLHVDYRKMFDWKWLSIG